MGNATLQKLTEYQRTEAVDVRGYTLQQAVEYEIRWRRDLSTTHPDQHGGPAKINIGHTTYRLLAEQFGALTPFADAYDQIHGISAKGGGGNQIDGAGNHDDGAGNHDGGNGGGAGKHDGAGDQWHANYVISVASSPAPLDEAL